MPKNKPLLLPWIDRSAKQILSRAGVDISLDEPMEWQKFSQFLAYCTGTNTLDQLASKTGLDSAAIEILVADLEQNGFVWNLPAYDEIPVKLFKAEFNRWLPIWVERMYDQPFWQELYDGTAPAAVFYGWAMENTHYTRTVISHMTLASRYAETGRWSAGQFNHLSEEWDHYQMFFKACAAATAPNLSLTDIRPLSSTLDITHFLRSRARQGTLVYNACEALLEASTVEADLVIDFYQTAGRKLNLNSTFIDELIRHVVVDQNFEHIDIFDHLLSNEESLTQDTVINIFSSCTQLVELFVLWHKQIYDHYRFYKLSELDRAS